MPYWQSPVHVPRPGKDDPSPPQNHVGDDSRRYAELNGGAQTPLSPFLISDIDEGPKPACVHLGASLFGRQRFDRKSGWLAGTLPSEVEKPLVKRPGTVLALQMGKKIGHTGQNTQGRSPAFCRAARAKARPYPQRHSVVG